MRKQIENTKAFKDLSVMQKQIYSKAKVMKEIEHHYIVANHKGVGQWQQEFIPPKVVKEIVLEMLN